MGPREGFPCETPSELHQECVIVLVRLVGPRRRVLQKTSRNWSGQRGTQVSPNRGFGTGFAVEPPERTGSFEAEGFPEGSGSGFQ